MRSGKSRAFLSLGRLGTEDRVTFTRRVRDAGVHVELDAYSPELSPQAVGRIWSQLAVPGDRVRWQSTDAAREGVDEHSSATLVSVLRWVTREMGHSDGDQSTVDFEGPVNQGKASAYYSWRR